MDSNIFLLFIMSPRSLDSAPIVPMGDRYQMSVKGCQRGQHLQTIEPNMPSAIITARKPTPTSQSKALVFLKLPLLLLITIRLLRFRQGWKIAGMVIDG